MSDVGVPIIISLLSFLVWWGVGKVLLGLVPTVTLIARALATAVWFSLVASYPFWALGGASSVGWYDAYDAIIPYEIFRAWDGAEAFNHAFAGGSQVKSMFFLGGSPWSLYVALIQLTGPQIGSLLFTLGGLITLFMGIYLTARRIFALDHLSSVYGALAGLFVMQYAQTGVLAGLGWNFSLMVWLGLLALSPMSQKMRIAGAALLAIAAAATTTIGFLLPTGFFYILGLLFASARPWRQTIIHNIVPAGVFAAILIVANYDLLQNLAHHAEESSRFLGLRSADALEAWAGGAGQSTVDSTSYRLNEDVLGATYLYLSGAQLLKAFDLTRLSLPPTFFYLGTLAVGLLMFPAQLWRISAATASLVGAAFLLTVLFGQTSLPFLSDFRWHELFTSTMPLLGLNVAILLAQFTRRHQVLRPLVLVWLSALLAVSMGVLAQGAITPIYVYGGWQVLGGYEKTLQAVPFDERQRAASFKIKSVAGAFNGIDVLDGMRQNFSASRTAFWFLSLYRAPPEAWHTHRHELPPDWSDVDVDMLRMANVGVVLSDRTISAPELELVAHQDAVMLAQMASDPWTRLVASVADTTVLPELNVYRIDGAWPRVFVPSRVTKSQHSQYSRTYYTSLKDVGYLELLVPAEGQLPDAGDRSLVLGMPAFTRNGMDVATSGSGILAYNQEFNGDWLATCEGGKELAIQAVNAIMMAVDVPADCGHLSFSVNGR